MSMSQNMSPADELLLSYKTKNAPYIKTKEEDTLKSLEVEPTPSRPIGGQKYGKPKLLKKKP